MYGRIFSPTSTPRTLPPAVARNAYPRYFDAMEKFPYPKAFMVPISILCSSTIRVIPVRLINAATRKNITGNTFRSHAYDPHFLRIHHILSVYFYHIHTIWILDLTDLLTGISKLFLAFCNFCFRCLLSVFIFFPGIGKFCFIFRNFCLSFFSASAPVLPVLLSLHLTVSARTLYLPLHC